MNGADAIAEVLRREGTEFLACFPAQPLIEACARAGIRPILCRQERVGMAIADGFSRASGGKRLGVFAMQQGPGSENAFPGAAQAFADNVPVLLIPGGEPTSRSFTPPGFSATDNYRGVTKWLAEINHVERVPELMRRAFHNLRSGKPGPVLLEVARDVWDQDLAGDLDYTPVRASRSAPCPEETAEVAKVLLGAERPVIHAGQGVLYSDASDELERLAELLQAPVMTTMPGKSAFPENHPLSLGASAVSTTKPIAHFLSQADVVLGVGCSFTQTSYGRAIPSGNVIIHATNDPADVNKDIRADYALIGDAGLVLRALIDEVEARTNGAGLRNERDLGPEVRAVKDEWLEEWMPQLTSDEEPINQYRVIWDLMHNVDRANTIVTHDAGSPRDQMTPFWETTTPRSYMGWGKTTQLGYGLGITMGAKLAEPDKLCVNVMGDAAIGMVGMDLETAARNQIGILTIVWNNGVMAIERAGMPFAIENYASHTLGGNYGEVTRALGGWGVRVTKPAEFVPALREAIAVTETGQPALIECIVKEGFDFSRYP